MRPRQILLLLLFFMPLAGFAEGTVEPALFQNNPNPFSGSTVIRFTLSEAGPVRLSVYDLIGHEVACLVDGELSVGEHAVRFESRDLPDGVYFYRLSAAGFNKTRICLLLK